MKMFLLKLTCFVLLVLTGQLVVYQCYEKQHLFPEKILLDQYLTEQTDILWFGDSTLATYSDTDVNKQSIPEMFKTLFPNASVGIIQHPAYGMDLFLSFCQYLAKRKPLPKLIVIPINLTSFSAVWDRRPSFQFQKEKLLLSEKSYWYFAFFEPLSIFRFINLNPISQMDFDNSPVYFGTRQVGAVKDFDNPSFQVYSEANMKKRLVACYMSQIQPTNRQYQSLLGIAELMAKTKVKVIFYVTPTDHQIGRKYLGNAFLRQLTANTRYIKSGLKNKHVSVIDLSLTLNSRLFNWQIYPTEHLNEQGRFFVAHAIYEALRQDQTLNWLSRSKK